MSRSPEFLALLDKYNIRHDRSDKYLREAARMMYCRYPANAEVLLLAYGHVIESRLEFQTFLEMIQAEQNKNLSLREVLIKVQELGRNKK